MYCKNDKLLIKKSIEFVSGHSWKVEVSANPSKSRDRQHFVWNKDQIRAGYFFHQ